MEMDIWKCCHEFYMNSIKIERERKTKWNIRSVQRIYFVLSVLWFRLHAKQYVARTKDVKQWQKKRAQQMSAARIHAWQPEKWTIFRAFVFVYEMNRVRLGQIKSHLPFTDIHQPPPLPTLARWLRFMCVHISFPLLSIHFIALFPCCRLSFVEYEIFMFKCKQHKKHKINGEEIGIYIKCKQ